MDSAMIDKLDAQREEATVAWVIDRFDDRRNGAGADRTMLGQTAPFLWLCARLPMLADRQASESR